MDDQEKEMASIFEKLSASGKIEGLLYLKIILKAETGMKKQLGLPEMTPIKAPSWV